MRNTFLNIIALALILSTSAYNLNAKELITPDTTQQVLEQNKENKPQFKHKKHFEKMSKKLTEELNLTKEQQEKAKLIRKEGHEKIEPLMKQMKELRTQMDKLRQENMEAFEKILTKEQQDKFNKIKEEGKKRHHSKGKKLKFEPKNQ